MNEPKILAELQRHQISRRGFIQRSLKSGLVISGAAFSGSNSILGEPSVSPEAFCYWSTKKLAQAIRDKKLSSEEVVRAHLARIAHVNGKINAVVQLATDRAIAEARAADAALAGGDIQGPLHGVPVTVKDSFDTAGIISTAGTKGRAHFVPTQDATVVARLRAAGAIVLGKTNTPEFTFDGVTDNLVYGRTNNPFDLTRTVGGSSGGAAAITAVGGSPLDVGTDTLASIRWPAHCCGVAGIKPTSGRASLAGHIVDSGSALGMQTQPGPIARFVEDLILAVSIISGPDSRDAAVQDKPLGNLAEVNLKSLRVAFYTTNGIVTPAAEIIQAVRNAATVLSSAVAKVEEKRPAELRDERTIGDSMFNVAGREYFRGLLEAAGTPLNEAGPWMRSFATSLPVLSASQKANALARRDAFAEALAKFMQEYDVILCPVSSAIAPLHAEAAGNIDPSYTEPYNLAGFPAAVVRVSTSSQGLPIGLQIIGRPWEEHAVLAVARYLEMALGGWQPVPRASLKMQGANPPRLSWKGFGTLQSSPTIDGNWIDQPEAASPYSITNRSNPAKFYRIRQ
jgi:amidase